MGEQNLERVKTCKKCEVTKPLKEFYKSNSATKDGLHPHCKECHSEYNKKRRGVNKEEEEEDNIKINPFFTKRGTIHYGYEI